MRSNSILSRSSQFRHCAVWVSLFAIALRAMVPVGWMPSAAEGSAIVICTAQGLTEIILGPDGATQESQDHQDGNRDQGSCVLAATAHFFAPASPNVPLPSNTHFNRLSLTEVRFLFSEFEAGLPQSRAPPTIS